jgi:hypothetical protein
MFVHVQWSTAEHGARNCWPGEYDTCFYFVLTMGLPVFVRFRGCSHAINVKKLRGARLQAIRRFAAEYLGLPGAEVGSLPPKLHLPLRPSPILRRQGFLSALSPLVGMWAFMAPLLTVVFLELPAKAFANREIQFWLAALWLGWVPLLLGLYVYFRNRRISPRQAEIRRMVAERLGPFTDPADWAPALVEAVALSLGIMDVTTAALTEQAEADLQAGQHADALIAARMAMAIAEPVADDVRGLRAEEITELCLGCELVVAS